MKRILKYFGITLAVLVGLSVLAVIAVNLIPGNQYKALIKSGVKSATGRELAINGDIDIRLFTTFAFKASDLKFSNADWGSRAYMASVDNIEGELALFPLLKGVLDVTLVVDNPDLLLEIHNSGKKNWQFGELAKEEAAEEKAASGGGLPLRPLIRKMHINGTRIVFLDGKSGDSIHIHSEKLHIGTADEKLAIELKGKFNDIPLAFSGGLDNAEFFIDNRPANVKFDGHFGSAKLAIQGTAGPLTPTFDLDMSLAIDTESMAVFSPLAGHDLPDLGPLSVSLKLTGKEGKYAVSDMTTTLNDKSLIFEAKGSVTDLAALTGIRLQAKADTGRLTEILKAVGLKSEHSLPDSFNATVVAEGSRKELAVKQFQAKIQGKGVNVNVSAQVKNIMTLEGVSADFSLNTKSTELIAEIANTKLPPFGPLNVDAKIVSEGKKLGLMKFKANLASKILHADIAGSVEDPLKLKDLNAAVNLKADSLTWLADYLKTDLPPLGAFKASAKIVSQDDTFGIKDFRANLDGDKLHAKVTGSAGNLLKLKAIKADVELGIESLAILSKVAKTELPALGPLNASAQITSKDDTYEIKDFQASLADKRIHVKVAGSVGDLLQLKAIEADVELGIESLAMLSDVVKTELPPIGPLKASANIASKGETFEASNIKAELSGDTIQAKVEASIEDMLKLIGINANINVAVDSLASLDSLVKMELPSSGPVTLEGNISGKGGLEAPISVATVLKSDGVTANLTGSIAAPMRGKGLNMVLTAEADSMQKVSKLTGTQFQGKKPVTLEGRFTTAENTYELAGLHLQIGEMDVKGQAVFNQPSEPNGRPRISGKLHVGKLDLSKLPEKADTSTETDSSPESSKEEEAEDDDKDKVEKDKIFPSEPLPFGQLKSVDADIEVAVESLTTRQLHLQDLEVRLTLDNGLLNVKPMKARVGNGTLKGAITLDASNTPAAMTADIEMTDATFINFGGKVHLLANLNGNGNSIAAIMADLDGQLEFDVRDVSLKSSFMTTFGADLLNALNPFSKDEETTELLCGIILFDIKEGIADARRNIAAQMTKITYFGGGEINLKTEKIDFGVNPKPRKGLGISLGGFAKLVYIGGTLAHPKIKLDPKAMAVQTGKYSAAIATGGITWAADLLWSKIKANSDVCAIILKKLDSPKKTKE